MPFTILLSVGLCLTLPWISRRLYRFPATPRWLSPVVLAYAVGILFGNLQIWNTPTKAVNSVAEGSMLVALPLLLLSIRLEESWRYAGKMLWVFLLCCLTAMAGVTITTLLFKGHLPHSWMVAGMVTGLETGGTPNLQALGIALQAPAEYVVLIQAADVVCGGIYLLLLVSVLHRFLGLFLPAFEKPLEAADHTETEPEAASMTARKALPPLLLTLVIILATLGLTYLLTGGISNTTLLILLLTTLSLAASFWPRVRSWPGVYYIGEYFLLIFCVALGLLADFRTLIAEGLTLLAYLTVVYLIILTLQWLLARLLRIDRDTLMLASTAAFFGPVFVAQVAAAIRNPSLLAPGIAVGLLGFAIGNYLGLGVAYLVYWVIP